MEILRCIQGISKGKYKVDARCIQGRYKVNTRYIQGIYKVYTRYIQGIAKGKCISGCKVDKVDSK